MHPDHDFHVLLNTSSVFRSVLLFSAMLNPWLLVAMSVAALGCKSCASHDVQTSNAAYTCLPSTIVQKHVQKLPF